MEKEHFYVRYNRENFEYYAGHGMRKTYKAPEEFTPLSQTNFGSFLYFRGYISDAQGNVIFGGRLGQYRYYDMDKVIRAALDDLKKEQEKQ